MAFKMRSGGGAVPFKQMGSTPSPLKKTYKDAYAAQSDEKKSGQTYEQFETAAKIWNKKKYGTTEPTRDGDQKLQPLPSSKPQESKRPELQTKAEPKVSEKPGGTSTMDQISRGEKPEGAKKVEPQSGKQQRKAVRTQGRKDRKELRVQGREDRKAIRKATSKKGKKDEGVVDMTSGGAKGMSKTKDLKRNFKNNPYDAAVSNAKTARLGGTEEKY